MLQDTRIRVNLPESIDFMLQPSKNRLNFPTGRFFYDPWVILDEYRGTIIEEILSAFPDDIGEARIIVLAPKTSYCSHADIDDRYHLNLSSEKSYLIDLDNLIMHPIVKDNKIWQMDAGRIHTATNFGTYNRAQLVVRKLLKENKINNLIKVKLVCQDIPYNYRYLYDNFLSPYLNRAVKDGKLNNFINNEYYVNFDFDKNFLNELQDVIIKSNLSLKVETND
jgi:hypothetical protein